MADFLSEQVRQKIDAVLRRAADQGRDMLYEHEVYAVLQALGMRVPAHVLVRRSEEITAQLLSRFGSNSIVLKVVAPDVAHKQKLGGVQVVHKDLEFLRYSFNRIHDAITRQGFAVKGLLLVEEVDYTQELGNEILLGFRESETFGPVISFSKGGTDAEHFATHFSAPNLILAPIDQQWSQALLESTHIHKKYVQQGKGHYISKLVDAGLRFSDLAVGYSNYFASGSAYVIKEFEVNPFVFTPDDRFVALDGMARFAPRSPEPIDLSLPPKATIAPFFEPNGVAVVGVSTDDPSKTGSIIFRNLVKLGRRDVYAVNPKGGNMTVEGRNFRVYPALTDIEGPVDLVIVTVPARFVLPVVRQCPEKRVRALILIPGGFSELDGNRDVETEILALARGHGFRVIGPNCLGIIYAGGGAGDAGINSFFISEAKLHVDLRKDTRVALLTQSGALGIIEIENLKTAISPRVIVSYGNQLDVDPCDLVHYFQDDPGVDVVGCYIEGFKRGAGRRFFNIAGKSKKPVIVYKAGRTEAGRKATQSHTASIAGEYAVAKAALKQAGLIVADTMIDHGDLIKTFALWSGFEVRGNRVAIIANAGYEKTSAADNLDRLVLAQFDDATIERLRELLPPMVVPDPLLDLTPMADDATFEGCIHTLLASEAVDALMISIVPHSELLHTTDAEIEQNPDNIAARIIRLVHAHKKPAAVSVNVISRADAVYNRLGKTLDAGGVPTFLTANRAMFCLNAFIRYRLVKQEGKMAEWLQ